MRRRRRGQLSQNNSLLFARVIPEFGTLAADSSDSTLFATSTANIAVNPTSRYLYFGKFSGAWKTVWTDTTGALLRGDEAGTYAVTIGTSGPAPFDTDDGAATDSHAGAVSASTSFTHEADCLIGFTVTTLPSSGGMQVYFRKVDSNNFWEIYLTSAGNFYLFETAAGTRTGSRAALGVVSSGDRIVIVCDNTTIEGYSKDVLRWTYASATNAATATAGVVQALGTGGTISDLRTWPRTLSGTAADILNKASA